MKYFSFLSELQREGIFYVKPSVITKFSPKEQLQYALGATLYMPGNKKDVASMIIEKKYPELCSMVLCLEDSIGDLEVTQAETEVVKQLQFLHDALAAGTILLEELPLIFIRVRSPEQIQFMATRLGIALEVLTGFVFPKFSINNYSSYLEQLREVSERYQVKLYAMPILETPDLLDIQTRLPHLSTLYQELEKVEDQILNVRIGATDLCGLYGIRRNFHTTIYDISIIRDFITDVVNIFGKEYVISGPVWEYFESSSRILKPELRQTPFKELKGEEGLKLRTQLLT